MKTRVCPRCGSILRAGNSTCLSCGDHGRGRQEGPPTARAAVLAGVALFLLLGTALTGYCFSVAFGGPPEGSPGGGGGGTPPPEPGDWRTTLRDLRALVTTPPQLVAGGGGGGPDVPPGASREVKQAIDRGVAWLKQNADQRHQVGAIALVGLTLLECGVPVGDAVVQRALTQVRQAAPTLLATYEMSTSIWFLDRVGQAQDRELIRMLALRLMAGQRQLGGWDYTCQALSGADQQELARLLESRPLADTWRDEMFSTLPGAPPAVEQPRFGQPRRPGGRMEEVPVVRWQPGEKLEGRAASREDNSLTQFAILALWAARKHGVPVERSLAFVEARFRTFQNADGTWGYMLRQSNHRDSMTCSGLLGLAVGRGLEKKKAEGGEVRDPALEKALGHVGRVVGRKQLTPEERAQVQARLRELLTRRARATTPQERQALEQELTQVRASLIPPVSGRMVGAESYGDLYFLWSLERMAVVWDLKTIAGKDWYAWGAEVILKAQQPGGQWQETHGPVADTCFALLFLKRVNVVQDLTARLRLLGKVKDPGHLNPDRP